MTIRWPVRIKLFVVLVLSLLTLSGRLTALSVSAAPGGVLLSYPFEVGYAGYGGARCRVLAVPRSSTPGDYWSDLLCGQNEYQDSAGNTVEVLSGYFSQSGMNANATYNEGTGGLALMYDNGTSETLQFDPAAELRS